MFLNKSITNIKEQYPYSFYNLELKQLIINFLDDKDFGIKIHYSNYYLPNLKYIEIINNSYHV